MKKFVEQVSFLEPGQVKDLSYFKIHRLGATRPHQI